MWVKKKLRKPVGSMGGTFKWSVALETATAVMGVATLVAALVAVAGLPETVPVHFGDSGAPDRWGSRFELLLMPIFGIIFPALVVGSVGWYSSGKQLHPWVLEQKRAHAATVALLGAAVCASGTWFSFRLAVSYLRGQSLLGESNFSMAVNAIVAAFLLVFSAMLVIWGIQLRRGKWGRTIAGLQHATDEELQGKDRSASTRMFGMLMLFLAALVALAAVAVAVLP